jgi:hypothetical protein
MSLVAIRLDAGPDRALDLVKKFTSALVDAKKLRGLLADDFRWLGQSVDPEKFTAWMKSSGARTENEKVLSASLTTSMPLWIRERTFGRVTDADRIGIFDLWHGTDVATIGVVIRKGTVVRAFDPAELVKFVRLARTLSA